jgi:hypothetical protein
MGRSGRVFAIRSEPAADQYLCSTARPGSAVLIAVNLNQTGADRKTLTSDKAAMHAQRRAQIRAGRYRDRGSARYAAVRILSDLELCPR